MGFSQEAYILLIRNRLSLDLTTVPDSFIIDVINDVYRSLMSGEIVGRGVCAEILLSVTCHNIGKRLGFKENELKAFRTKILILCGLEGDLQ